jgi:EAL domain-containing protein (putative c-di-GMP-specific phosphodiesterase class I)
MTTQDDSPDKMTTTATSTNGAASASASPSRRAELYRLDLRDLLIDYDQREAFVKKADREVHDLIASEIRPGEIFRTVSPGVYHMVFPRAGADMAAMRNAAIEEKVARYLRSVKPAAYNAEAFNERSALAQKIAAARRSAKSGEKSSIYPPVKPSPTHIQATRTIETIMDPVNYPGAAQEFHLSDADRHALSGLKMRFHPMWHVHNKLITGYRCVYSYKSNRVTVYEAGRLLREAADEVVCAKVDIATCQQAIAGVQSLLQHGQKALMIVPVHYSTIEQARFLAAFVDTIGKASDDAKKLIVFEILGVPTGLSRFKLHEPLSHVRARCRGIVVRTGADFSNFEMYRELGVHAVGLDAFEYRSWKEQKLIVLLEQFGTLAQRYRLHSFVHGVQTNSMTVAAVASGFTYVDGPAIATDLDSPERIHAFAVESLYTSKVATT